MPLKAFIPDQYPNLHPIFMACRQGDENAMRMHLEAGVSVYIEDSNHASLISTAIEGCYPRIIELLVAFGLDLDKEINRFGETPLLRALAEKNSDVIKTLVQGGASINKPDHRGFTPIMSAAAGGDVEALELLAGLGADIQAQNQRGRTALTEAASNNQITAMNWLVIKGANVEHRDDQGATPLLSAAKAGKREAVDWLFLHGAEINVKDRRGKSALQWAETNRHTAVAELLRQRGAK